MKQLLQMGANTVLGTQKGNVTVSYEISNKIDISLTAFLLTDSDKVQGDGGIIFYNQPKSPSGVATLIPPVEVGGTIVHKIDFDMSKVPEGIVKMAITLTEDNSTGFSNVKNLKAEICTDDNNIIELAPSSFANENGIVVLELYLRNGQTKARSVWCGFDSGLEGLCENYGVEVDPEEQKSPSEPKAMDEQVAKEPYTVHENKSSQNSLSTISLEKVKGNINLDKGQKPVIIDKTPEITATVSWKTGTDYDIYALVYTKDGKQIDVAMFGAQGTPPLRQFGNGAVEHMGDVGRSKGSIKTEIIKLRLTNDILAVVPVVYSAQSNGTGSFYRYKVSMSIDNNSGTSVTISSKNANNNDRIYTCVPGILHNTQDGVIISPLELYSKPNSECRPKLKLGSSNMVEVLMDKGPKNDYK